MNLNFKSYLKHLPMAGGAIRYARAVAFRFALHETGALLCASAPLVFRAGEALQDWSDPHAARMSERPSHHQPPAYQEPSSFDEPSSFNF